MLSKFQKDIQEINHDDLLKISAVFFNTKILPKKNRQNPLVHSEFFFEIFPNHPETILWSLHSSSNSCIFSPKSSKNYTESSVKISRNFLPLLNIFSIPFNFFNFFWKLHKISSEFFSKFSCIFSKSFLKNF